MNKLFKTTLLITMAVVTWKVIKINSRLNIENITSEINRQNTNGSGFSLF
ncbi:hypothetical protein J3T65_05340 [Staphylococcus simiae]|nr:hypothetical protein [Staphylococcus simiae]